MSKILFMVFIANIVHTSEIFNEFSKAHDWMPSNILYQMETSFTSQGTTTNISIQQSLLLVTTTAKVIFLQEDIGEPILFFNSDLGSWITKPELPSPLKVSGAYNVYGIMNIDDIIGLNFQDSYKVEESVDSQQVLLKANRKNTTYQYVLLHKVRNSYFEAIYMDVNKVPVKKGFYDIGTVNNIQMIKKAVFNDLLINTNRYSSYEVRSVKSSNIPRNILSPERFSSLFNVLK